MKGVIMFKPKIMFIAFAALMLSVVLFLAASISPVSGTIPEGKLIEFKQGKVYEFAALWVKPGKEAQLMQYFNQAFAIAMKYGIQPVLNFTPESSYAGDFKPTMFFVNEWPSLEAFKQFINDPRERSLIPQRDDALIRLAVTHALVRQPTSVTLKDGDLIEFSAVWIEPGKQEQLNRYYGQAFPIAVKHGAWRLAEFLPVNVYRGDLDPEGIGLNQWPNLEAFRNFIKDEALQELLPTRDEALSRLVVNLNRVSFEEGAR
jgi:uncharacterized protein (DUF1330 family)